MIPSERDHNNDNTAEIRVILARFEAKLDVALAQHSARLELHDQALTDVRSRLTKVEDRDVPTHDEHTRLADRVRDLELTPTVSPKALWTAFIGAVGALTALSPFIDRLTR